ncbi:cytochrome c oxidase subunit 2 [Kordiimonadales bacterium JCM 17843]|nr:cytochrome c oxidase subunit 2 [Kordiimonadales bacterium JCM 17843]
MSAVAQVVRKGEDGHFGFQPAATPIMEQLTSFHNLLLWIITVITVMVAILLVWVMIRYNRKSNPKPSKTSHNTLVEVVWTVVPILILVLIAIPSFKLLYLQDEIPEADLVVKATGHQWYWSYEYPDYDNMAFDALMLDEKYYTDMSSDAQGERQDAEMRLAEFLVRDEPPQTFRLLDTDTRIVVPVGKVVKMLVTASDVLHSWAIPSFGVKIDAVPGRLNETWFQADEIGTYYGQCSEICGIRHAYMPIVVEVVSEEDFKLWVEKARAEYAEAPGSTRLASAGRQVH